MIRDSPVFGWSGVEGSVRQREAAALLAHLKHGVILGVTSLYRQVSSDHAVMGVILGVPF